MDLICLPVAPRLFSDGMTRVTQGSDGIAHADPQAASQLLPLLYKELRQLAAHHLAHEQPGQTLDATSLVHEAYLRLVGPHHSSGYRDRSHFFKAAATAMRRVVIDHARRKRAQKRGGNWRRQDLDLVTAATPDEELIHLDQALERLAAKDPIKSQLVELRFFAGLTGEEAAAVLGISPATADRHWAFARAWLQAEVRDR
jgi:RNA polymerase sigma factor (TIGR02999 family)